jgi:hypothetical protein
MRLPAALGFVSCFRATGPRIETTGSNAGRLVSVSGVLREGKGDKGE